jgi:hypothetical protein
MAREVAVDDVGVRRHSGARGNTPWAHARCWALSLSKAAPCMYTVSVYKLAHIRAVHTINETGHGYGLSLGAGFQFFHLSGS